MLHLQFWKRPKSTGTYKTIIQQEYLLMMNRCINIWQNDLTINANFAVVFILILSFYLYFV